MDVQKSPRTEIRNVCSEIYDDYKEVQNGELISKTRGRPAKGRRKGDIGNGGTERGTSLSPPPSPPPQADSSLRQQQVCCCVLLFSVV